MALEVKKGTLKKDFFCGCPNGKYAEKVDRQSGSVVAVQFPVCGGTVSAERVSQPDPNHIDQGGSF